MDEKHLLMPRRPHAASKIARLRSLTGRLCSSAAILRPFNNFGPQNEERGDHPIVIQRALQVSPLLSTGWGVTRDFIFAPQAADAVRTYEEPVTRGQVMNVAPGQENSINRLVREILAVLDIDVPIVHEAPCPGDVRRHRSAIGLA